MTNSVHLPVFDDPNPPNLVSKSPIFAAQVAITSSSKSPAKVAHNIRSPSTYRSWIFIHKKNCNYPRVVVFIHTEIMSQLVTRWPGKWSACAPRRFTNGLRLDKKKPVATTAAVTLHVYFDCEYVMYNNCVFLFNEWKLQKTAYDIWMLVSIRYDISHLANFNDVDWNNDVYNARVLCLSVCMCVWMDGWMDRCMDAFVYPCMHVCMCACVHVCMYARMHVCTYACMHVCMYACMHICMYAYMYVWYYVCMYGWMDGCMDVLDRWMYVCMYVCMYACMHVCMHACMYVCKCICNQLYDI